MPSSAKIALHSDFTIEQHDYIKKNIRVVGKKESIWDGLCKHDRMPKADKIEYRHQVLIDPVAVHVLTENATPDPTSVAAAKFKADVFNVGSWFKYSRESRDLNLDSIVEMGSNQLAHERLYDLDTIRGNAYRGTTVAATMGQSETVFQFLLKVKTMLKKNGAKPIRGNDYLCRAPGEILNTFIDALGDKLKAVPAGEQMITSGVMGRCAGFQFEEVDDDTMYVHVSADATNNITEHDEAIALFIGRNEFGEFPVTDRSYTGFNDSVGSKGCEPDKEDPMGNWGFISSRIDGVGAVLTDEACVVKYMPTITLISKSVPSRTLSNITSQNGVVFNTVAVKPNQARTDAEAVRDTTTSKVEAEYDD